MQSGTKVRLPRRALSHLRAADGDLARVIDDVGRFAMVKGRADNGLEALVRSIVYQQLSGKAAATIYRRFRELFDGQDFPAAATIVKVHHARLRKAGLSRQKQAAIRDLCRHVDLGLLPLGAEDDLDDEELIERLTAVRGIGRWSAQMYLMFHLGRLDVWPEDDLGVRKGVQRMLRKRDLPDRRMMRAVGARYAPYRTVAAWYMWRSLDAEAQI